MNTTNNFPTIYPVTCHTRHVGPGTTFVAINGTRENGVQYIPQALAQGATSIVIEHNEKLTPDMIALIKNHNAHLINVPNARSALAQLSAEALDYPAQKLKIIGITGTKGKSTTTFLVEHFIKTAGYKTALLSTVKNRIVSQEFPTQLTTQQPDYLHIFLHECVKADVEWVVMEVAAQALSLHRIEGILFDAIIYTNFNQEHAEFYPTIEEYFQAKSKILTHAKPYAPLIMNAHDHWLRQLPHYSPKVLFASKQNPIIHCPALIGEYNALNINAAAQCAHSIGIPWHIIQKAALSFSGVPGRLEKYHLPNGALGIIDYAHNPSSYEAVLGTLRSLTNHLIVIFGCGGERDTTKRPLMGEIATRIADLVFITSDNPRSEDPQSIVDDICAGIPPEKMRMTHIDLDRESAIKKAYAFSQRQSFIVLLGKGPDEYQLINGIKHHFSEKDILRNL